jgi:hypothetical protein
MALLRRRLLPTAVRARLHLTAGDALLSVAALADGTHLAASRFALHHLRAEDVASWPWHEVDRASWDPEDTTLRVTLVTGEEIPLALGGDKHRSFTQTVRERVQSSVVAAASRTLPGGAVVRVAVRRRPDGELYSQVIAPGTVDLAEPATARLVDELEDEVRQAAGLP